ncbi:MAG TPA: hypothetical protein VLX91_13880 [Candidatus Acidoferrales bacterium]|nr:hypothetical protein [Candidatus Acidoferrales bacterium]
MADCECLAGCPFFNDKMADMPGLTTLYKRSYCQGGEFAQCARYMVFKALGKPSVPADLFPNQVERAKALIGNR